jgi:excinuclease ABC subunit A
MPSHELIIEGARQNNLKNISLRLPHNKVIAVTGVSGSGKSSLVFDTIFAEGQWRFIESISTYARLFLEKLDRPDVDGIYHIRPAVALEQKNPVRSSRSMVGTITEIYDLLRLLYAKVATPHCPDCGKEVRRWDTTQVMHSLLDGFIGRKALILFDTEESLENLKKRGFRRILHGGRIVEIDELPENAHRGALSVVLDRVVIREDPRLSDSLDMAWKEGNERITVMVFNNASDALLSLPFSSANSCESCGIEIPEPTPLLFSFNHPVGACPSCKGFGNILSYDEALIVPDQNLSLSEGAIEPWEKPAYRWWKRQILDAAKKLGIDTKKPYRELSMEERQKIFKGGTGLYGIDDFFEELEGKRYKLHVRVFLSRYRNATPCQECGGKRLRREALAYRISGHHIAELSDMPVSELRKFFKEIDLSPFQRDLAREILRQVELKLSFLHRVGLDYLTLSRQGRTLSGGEYQRVNLSNQLASFLTGTLYVLDEPTVGLHARDTERISKIMNDLSEMGNTIIVVEHDKGIIGSAHWIVELGPGGGRDGGEVVFSGPMDRFMKADTLTSRYLRGIEYGLSAVGDQQRDRRKTSRGNWHEKGEFVTLLGARGNNLKDIDLRIPLRKLTSVTGVSGSGKSSLIVETLYRALAKQFRLEHASSLPYRHIEGITRINGLKIIDQAPVGRSPRSNPVTYLKVFDHIRRLFSEQPESKAQGYTPGFFSFNVPGGRCEICKGEGYQKLEMYFFEDIYVTCEECGGKRYKAETLKVVCRGRTIDEVLQMTVDEASEVFSDVPQIHHTLSLMKDVGLGYLRLGQPANTLSGGEAQRLKICAELSPGGRSGLLYILDEPTVGLHHVDVTLLIRVLKRLVDARNTVVVIEHNLDVITASDWIIDLGPEGGEEGGRIIFEGTPEEILQVNGSYTGEYLRRAMVK